MEIKKATCKLAVTLVVVLVFSMPVLAQTDQTLNLRLSRDFGYSSGTGHIQGAFSMIASGPESLERVAIHDRRSGGRRCQPTSFPPAL